MIAATYLSVVTAGNVLTVVIVLTAGWAYLRRESGSVWKSVAEGLEKKVALLEEQNRLLTAENATLRARPDMQMVNGVLVRHGQLLDQIEKRLESHAQAGDERHAAIMGALAGLTQHRDPPQRDRQHRDPRLRERRSDRPES